MSDPSQTLPEFLRTRVVERFRDMVNKAEQRLAQVTREVEELRTATGTVGWEVGDDDGLKWFVNLVEGEMTVSEKPASLPFVTIVLSAADWDRFVNLAPGGLFAGEDRLLGRSRIDRVRAIKGSVRFVLVGLPGGGDFIATLHFGSERTAEPKATIEMPVEVAAKIQSGALNPQSAFMQGQMKLIGDMGFAMQLGIALLL